MATKFLKSLLYLKEASIIKNIIKAKPIRYLLPFLVGIDKKLVKLSILDSALVEFTNMFYTCGMHLDEETNNTLYESLAFAYPLFKKTLYIDGKPDIKSEITLEFTNMEEEDVDWQACSQ